MSVTIVLPVSRPHFLKRVFASLDELMCDKDSVKLLVYVDGNMELFDKTMVHFVKSKYLHKKCFMRNKGTPSVSSVRGRRKRIAAIHNELKHMVDTEFVLSVEDDTIVPYDALTKMFHFVGYYPRIGFVTGIELGRWGYTHIGAWRVNNLQNITEIKSISLCEGVMPIHASGLYCCMFRTKDYLEHEFKPFENVLGPDFDFGVALCNKGYQAYVDGSIRCAHMTMKEDIVVENSHIVELVLKKESDRWLLQQLNQTIEIQ